MLTPFAATPEGRFLSEVCGHLGMSVEKFTALPEQVQHFHKRAYRETLVERQRQWR